MSAHVWRFFTAGGFDQVSIDSAEDIRNLKHLDQKLWVALACPTVGLELDRETLKRIDGNDDARVRAGEVLAAVAWCDKVLKDLGALTKRQDGLPLAELRTDTDEGRAVLASAKRILSELKTDAGSISVSQTTQAADVFAKMRFNGDGVLPVASVPEDDADVRAHVTEILDAVGSAPDRSGEPGVTRELVTAFYTEAAEYLAWWDSATTDDSTFTPLGDQTAVALEALEAVRAKIDDYFARCALVSFDARAAGAMSRAADDWLPIAGRLLAPNDAEVAAFPLAAVAPNTPLPLTTGVNPAWRDAIEAFRERVVLPVLGEQDALTDAAWAELKARFQKHEAWLAAKKGARVEKLGADRVRTLLTSDLRATIEELLDEDEARRPEAEALEAVDRAARYYRDLHRLLDNFVSFRDFYAKRDLAVFQAGTLYLDARSCELCVRVEDVGAHATLAAGSHALLAYCDCVQRGADAKTMKIVAAFTDGDSDFLAVGRNGVFYDREGNDWDATIVRLVDNPISIRQAFWAPYKRVANLISQQIERFAASKNDAVNAQAEAQVAQGAERTTTAAAPATAPAAAAPAAPTTGFDVARFAGIFAAIGLAVGVLGSALAAIVSGFLALRLWQMPIAVAGVMLLISGPSMLLAALKLRQRNLAPLLDASGWAINARARINIPFGASLTGVAELPKGSKSSNVDPYKDKKPPIWLFVAILVAVCTAAVLWDVGLLPKWLGLVEDPNAAASEDSAPADAAPAEGSETAAPEAPAA